MNDLDMDVEVWGVFVWFLFGFGLCLTTRMDRILIAFTSSGRTFWLVAHYSTLVLIHSLILEICIVYMLCV